METKCLFQNKGNISYSISWGVVEEHLYVFDEIQNKAYIFNGIIKDFWVLAHEGTEWVKIIDMLNRLYSDQYIDVEKYIDKIINKLERYSLLERWES